MKTEIDAERDARQVLEERVRQSEKRPPTTTYGSNSEEEVDKNIAIIGGFAEKTIEEAEHLVREMMTRVHGFEDVAMTSSSPAIAVGPFPITSAIYEVHAGPEKQHAHPNQQALGG